MSFVRQVCNELKDNIAFRLSFDSIRQITSVTDEVEALVYS